MDYKDKTGKRNKSAFNITVNQKGKEANSAQVHFRGFAEAHNDLFFNSQIVLS